jgi:hypothetical protein
VTEQDLHELFLIGLTISANVFVWHFIVPERKWLALISFALSIIIVFLPAKRGQVDLTHV